MENRYQRAIGDGTLNWTAGAKDFTQMWERAHDELRFHRGEGFRIRTRPGEEWGPVRRLSQVADHVRPRLDTNQQGTLTDIRSEKDLFTLVTRRMEIEAGGDHVLDHAREKIGIPYVFGVTDCSWLTMACYRPEGVELPHNAHAQHLQAGRAGFVIIPRSKIKPGDLLFLHNDDHVALYLDDQGEGRVIDTEPHDTRGPAGWPSPNLGTGVRVRPMNAGYYCDWQSVNGIMRIVAVNGAP